MATIKQLVGTRSALTVTGLSTLAAGTYVASAAYVANTNAPLDVIVEVDAATTNVPAGNMQLVAFVIDSLDGTNYRSGPTSGTATIDEAALRFLGTVPLPATGTKSACVTFSVAQALGYVPYAFKVVLKNDLGVALTSGAVYTSEVSGSVV